MAGNNLEGVVIFADYTGVETMDIRRVCKNCADYDKDKSECTVRFTRILGKGRVPMKRKPNQGNCVVFLSNAIYSTKAI